MGNKTKYWGQINIEPPLSPTEIEYLNEFNETRRMLRKNGPYFVGGTGMRGQNENDPDVLIGNQPPLGQPSLWCQWIPTEHGRHLEWDRNPTFHYAAEWMLYLIQHFLKPGAIAIGHVPGIVGDHVANGFIEVVGEGHPADYTVIRVEDNKVYRVRQARLKDRVQPEPYKIEVYSPRTAKIANELFGVWHPLMENPTEMLTLGTPVDLETGLPLRNIFLHDAIGRTIAEWYISDNGKAQRVGTLEWTPPEES